MADAATNGPMEARWQLSIDPVAPPPLLRGNRWKAGSDGLRLMSPRSSVCPGGKPRLGRCLVRHLFGVKSLQPSEQDVAVSARWRIDARPSAQAPRLSPMAVVYAVAEWLASQRHVAGKTGRAVVCRDSLRMIRFQGLLAAFSFSGRLFPQGACVWCLDLLAGPIPHQSKMSQKQTFQPAKTACRCQVVRAWLECLVFLFGPPGCEFLRSNVGDEPRVIGTCMDYC